MNQFYRRIVLTSVAIMTATLGAFVKTEPTSAKSAKPATEKKTGSSSGWRINYFPGQVSSSSTVYLSNDAIKIVTDGSFEIVAKAPTWNAIVTNTKTRRSCELSPSRWMKDGFFLDRPDAKEYMNPKHAESTEKINYRGLKSKKRVWQTIESDAFYRYRSKPQRCAIELISTDGVIPISPMQRELISAWYGIPNLDGVPLFWRNVMKNDISQRLKVVQAQPVSLGPADFVPLKGTKREDSMLKLVDKKYSTALTDFIEMDQAIEETAKNSKSTKRTDK